MSSVRSVAALEAGAFAGQHHVVVAFCADWCGTCRDFRPVLERLSAAHEQLGFLWVDIEDDAAVAGDIEVESFPSLLILREGRPVYFGTSLPLEEVVDRLIRSALSSPVPLSPAPEEVWSFGALLVDPAPTTGAV
ncbi:thioredoxin [Azoarcus communis]|uniref:Thioredoxin n=1 Tax=Parazoarcus communis SWub3 = DSM 12120 TaxID=1121029 RepID=A0A323UQX8_9RHOO|nr:thioredoxin family protein [Parazoarcus communis]NMG48212.1 thioredoxin [Parazoarcus communis]NMG70963.1 thioredoxin [Parazoarcus communis SWub3 = DSM 12120]PZA15432.1 thioredoxin [Azoarcus communis] [Parazoarcus communis SWub3 = DSM 12120]